MSHSSRAAATSVLLNRVGRIATDPLGYADNGFDITFALGGMLLDWLGISTLYLPLLYVDVVGAALQVVLLGILNVLFYLDQRRSVLLLTATLPLTNMIFTAISLQLGATWFGYGFALAMLVTVLLGIWILNRKLEALEYQTFMLQ